MYVRACVCSLQVKMGSEKGWSNLQSYMKQFGPAEEGNEEDGAEYGAESGMLDGDGDKSRKEEGEVQCDVGDLLGFQPDSSGHAQYVEKEKEGRVKEEEGVPKKHRKKKMKKKEPVEDNSASLISFSGDWTDTTTTSSSKTAPTISSLSSANTEPCSKSKKNESRSGGGGGRGYGSVGISRTEAVNSTSAAPDVAVDWEADWSKGVVATKPTAVSGGGGGGGWEEEDWGEGWSNVDLQSKID